MPEINSSQDPEYEGPVYHEKKFHKTHFGVNKRWRGLHPRYDPEWEEIGVGRWRRVLPERKGYALQKQKTKDVDAN